MKFYTFKEKYKTILSHITVKTKKKRSNLRKNFMQQMSAVCKTWNNERDAGGVRSIPKGVQYQK